jgi:hypothetical protein
MWSWIGENHGAVSAVAGCLTLVVWLLYFQLLYLEFRRAQRAKILISIAGGAQVDAQCILANMSREPIYIEAVAVSLLQKDGVTVRSLTDLRLDERRADLRSSAMQGPLASGEMISLGSFRDLLTRTDCNLTPQAELRFLLTAIAVYAGEDRLVAAERAFVLRDEQLLALSPAARQLRSRHDRARLNRLLRDSAVMDRLGTGGQSPTRYSA